MNSEPVVEDVYLAESTAEQRIRGPGPGSRADSGESYDDGQSLSPTKTLAPEFNENTPLIASSNKFNALRDDAQHTTKSSSPLEKEKKPSIWCLLPCLAMFTISYGGALVPKTNLVLSMICSRYITESHSHLTGLPSAKNPQCRVPEVQSRTATFMLLMTLIPGALSAFASPKYGAASDSHGRLKMLAIVVFGTLLSEVMFLLVASNPNVFHLNTLLIGAVFEGLSGTVTSVLALSTSYAADVIAPERRNVAFGYFHGLFFGGLALGPMLAGMMMKKTGDPLHVFYTSTVLYIAFFICVVFLVPESLSKERQGENREKKRTSKVSSGESESILHHLNPCKLFEPLSIFSQKVDHIPDLIHRKQAQKIKRNLLILAALDTVVFGVKMGSSSVIIIYAEYLFGWGNVESSFFVSLVSSVRMVMLLGALPIMTRLIRGPKRGEKHVNTGCDGLDVGVIRTSVFIDTLCYIAYACSTTGVPFTISGAIDAVGAMVSPTLQSSLTKHVQPNQTGQVLGAMGLLHSLSRVIVPIVFNLLYSKTVGTFPQAIFVALVGFAGTSFCLSLFLKTHVLAHDTDDDSDINHAESARRRVSNESDESTLLDE